MIDIFPKREKLGFPANILDKIHLFLGKERDIPDRASSNEDNAGVVSDEALDDSSL